MKAIEDLRKDVAKAQAAVACLKVRMNRTMMNAVLDMPLDELRWIHREMHAYRMAVIATWRQNVEEGLIDPKANPQRRRP